MIEMTEHELEDIDQAAPSSTTGSGGESSSAATISDAGKQQKHGEHSSSNGGGGTSSFSTASSSSSSTMLDAFDWQEYSDWATNAQELYDDCCTTRAVQTFMSGNRNYTHSQLVGEIEKRRKHFEAAQSHGVPYKQVSYEIVDTPIWHYRNNNNNNPTAALLENDKNDRRTSCRPGLRRRRRKSHNKEQAQLQQQQEAAVASSQQDEEEEQDGIIQRNSSMEDDEKSRQLHEKERRQSRVVGRLALFIIGFIMSIVGFTISYSADNLNDLKINFALNEVGSDDNAAAGFGFFIGINVILALTAFIPVVFRPHSAGSGIAEAKAVLNGLVIENCTDLLTAACKGLSVIFAASASLPIGLEGPLIFIGLSIGEHACRFIPRHYPSLRTDRARRDFAAVGTASGVSVAFYAPIGGVLFALEEGASFWSQILMWRCFAAACVTLFVTYFWVACESRSFDRPIDFSNTAKFAGLHRHENVSYPFDFYLRDFFVFMVFGVFGGCAGALFNWLNKNLAIWRRRNICSFFSKLLEVAVLTSVMSTLQWWLPIVYKQCSPMTGPMSDLPEMDDDVSFVYRQHNCNAGEYNHLATLFLNNLSTVINLLFHAPPGAFTPVSCVIAGTVYYVMLIILFGTSIGMGIFIPILYIGGCVGRAIGIVMTTGGWYTQGAAGTVSSLVHSYSVVMATAMLGGVTQVLISLSVIMMQATALSYFVIPFMLVTIFARVVARKFGAHGIYDQILHLKGLPFLEETPPEFIKANSSLRARDIMSPAEVSLYPEMRVSALLDILRHGGDNYEYQVVSPLEDEALIGIIQRSHVLFLLQHKELFYSLNDSDMTTRPAKALKYDVLVKTYPTLPSLDRIERDLDPDDVNKYLDLSPYLQIAPHAVDGHCSAERAYESFRMIGLRNLLVLGPNYKPIGVIRRSDLFILEDCSSDERKDTQNRHQSTAQYSVVS